MAWPTPPASGVDIQDYEFLKQFPKAIQERHYAAHNCTKWPRPNNPWDSGTSTSITDTGSGIILSDSSKNWFMPVGATGASRWVGYALASQCFMPADYDVVVEAGGIFDEKKCVRGIISANTSGTLTFNDADVKNAITAGYISSVSSLSGKPYYIIKRDGLWWSDFKDTKSRWPSFPNDPELWRGTVLVGSEKYLRNTGDTNWQDNQFAGKDVLVFSGSTLKRLTVICNSNNTLYFGSCPSPIDPSYIDSSPAYSIANEYIIVEADDVGMPNRGMFAPFLWYNGAMDNAQTHLPDDTISSAYVPASSREWLTGGSCVDAGPCDTQSFNAFDVDLWSDIEEACGSPDHSYSPDIAKALRFWQTYPLDLCVFFIDNNETAPDYPEFTPARVFYRASVNAGTSSVIDKDGLGIYHASVSSTYEGKDIYWTVKTSTGGNRLSGLSTCSSGSISLGGSLYNTADLVGHPERTSDVGATVLYSAGFSRYYPREFRYAKPKTIFIPDTDGDNVLTVSCTNPGEFVRREASTTYFNRSFDGLATDGNVAFASGVHARYIGDNALDPSIRVGSSLQSVAVTDGEDGTDVYWDRFFVGTHTDSIEAMLVSNRRGTVTEAGNYFLRDSTKDWYTSNWHGGTTIRTESGTATGGSTTTLIDSTKDPTISSGCFWATSRFPDGKPYRDFILKVTNGSNSGLLRPITDSNGATRTLTVTPAFPNSIIAGTTYQIDEPYELNRYEGLTVRLYDLVDPASYQDVQIKCNDRTGLYWDNSLSIASTSGQNYEIIEHSTGGVWRFQNIPAISPRQYMKIDTDKYWVETHSSLSTDEMASLSLGDLTILTDDDLVPDPRGAEWHDDSRENLPTKATKDYGFFNSGDYLYTGLFSELQSVINVLQKTRGDSGEWVDPDPDDIEVAWHNENLWSDAANRVINGDPIGASGAAYYTKTGMATNINGFPYCYTEGHASWTWTGSAWTPAGGYIASAGRHYDKYRVTVPSCISCDVDFWCHAIKPGSGTADGVRFHREATFDANGDEVIEGWNMWDTETASTGVVTSQQLGSLGTPNMTVQPPDPTTTGTSPGQTFSSSTIKGYIVDDIITINNWTFTYT